MPSQPLVYDTFVQVRGSIPLYWTHSNLMSPKPDIVLCGGQGNGSNGGDYSCTRQHFELLQERYSQPIVCLNLVKQKEKVGRACRLR